MFQRAMLALAVAGLVASLARVAFLYLRRTPVQARLVGCLLGADGLAHERRQLAADREYRRVLCKVSYVVAGREYRSDVKLGSRAGETPDDDLVVWIDPADPTRVTGDGPGSAMGVMLASLVWIIAALRTGGF